MKITIDIKVTKTGIENPFRVKSPMSKKELINFLFADFEEEAIFIHNGLLEYGSLDRKFAYSFSIGTLTDLKLKTKNKLCQKKMKLRFP